MKENKTLGEENNEFESGFHATQKKENCVVILASLLRFKNRIIFLIEEIFQLSILSICRKILLLSRNARKCDIWFNLINFTKKNYYFYPHIYIQKLSSAHYVYEMHRCNSCLSYKSIVYSNMTFVLKHALDLC